MKELLKDKGVRRLIIFIVVCIILAIPARFLTSSIAAAREEKTKVAIAREMEKIAQEEKIYKHMMDVLTNWVYEQSSKIPKNLAGEIVTYAYEVSQHPKLVLGIIAEESNFDIYAYRNDTKVYGLGQIKYDVWHRELKQFGIQEPRDLFDWKKNIVATNYIINKYYRESKNLNKALSRYVGEINNDMAKYRNNILSHIGSLSLIEGEMVKFMIKNKRLYQITANDIELVEGVVKEETSTTENVTNQN